MEPPKSIINKLLSDVDVYDIVFQNLGNNIELVKKMQIAKHILESTVVEKLTKDKSIQWMEILPSELIKVKEIRLQILSKLDRDSIDILSRCYDSPVLARRSNVTFPEKCELLSNVELKINSEFTRKFFKQIGLNFHHLSIGTKEVNAKGIRFISQFQKLFPMRDYQLEIATKLGTLLTKHSISERGVLISLPTGAGKTRICIEGVLEYYIKEHLENQMTVLWINDKKELCEQAATTFEEIILDVGVRDGGFMPDAGIVSYYDNLPEENEFLRNIGRLPSLTVFVATGDQIIRREKERSLQYIREVADILIFDEAHLGLNETKSIIDLLKPKARIALTATPDRGTEELFPNQIWPDDTFDLTRHSMEDALIESGVLSKKTGKAEEEYYVEDHIHEKVGALSYEKYTRSYNVSYENQFHYRTICDLIIEEIMENRSNSILVFVDRIMQARIIKYMLLRSGSNFRSEAVWGEMHRLERKKIILMFKSGEIDVLINVDLLKEGFDAPKVDCVIIATNTIDMSKKSYTQKIGRGLRGPASGGTEFCKIYHIKP
jgi:superfamily II DNA or RNA helicase